MAGGPQLKQSWGLSPCRQCGVIEKRPLGSPGKYLKSSWSWVVPPPPEMRLWVIGTGRPHTRSYFEVRPATDQRAPNWLFEKLKLIVIKVSCLVENVLQNLALSPSHPPRRRRIGVHPIFFGVLGGLFLVCQLLTTFNLCGPLACGTSPYKSLCAAQRSLDVPATIHKPNPDPRSDAFLLSKPAPAPHLVSYFRIVPSPSMIALARSPILRRVLLQI